MQNYSHIDPLQLSSLPCNDATNRNLKENELRFTHGNMQMNQSLLENEFSNIQNNLKDSGPFYNDAFHYGHNRNYKNPQHYQDNDVNAYNNAINAHNFLHQSNQPMQSNHNSQKQSNYNSQMQDQFMQTNKNLYNSNQKYNLNNDYQNSKINFTKSHITQHNQNFNEFEKTSLNCNNSMGYSAYDNSKKSDQWAHPYQKSIYNPREPNMKISPFVNNSDFDKAKALDRATTNIRAKERQKEQENMKRIMNEKKKYSEISNRIKKQIH